AHRHSYSITAAAADGDGATIRSHCSAHCSSAAGARSTISSFATKPPHVKSYANTSATNTSGKPYRFVSSAVTQCSKLRRYVSVQRTYGGDGARWFGGSGGTAHCLHGTRRQ